MAGPYDQNALVGHHARGDAERVLSIKSRFGHGYLGGAPTFVRMVILEVISDPGIIDTPKLTHWEHNLFVSNIKYASVAPRNSIIAKRILGNGAAASEKTMVLYPFFPPHMAFPAKPGEHVWAIFENPDAKVNELGYWMCRIVGPHFVEDLNYSHSDRQFDPSFVPGIADIFEGTDDPKYEFPNGVIDQTDDGQRFIVGSTATISGADEKAYETLLKETEAAKIMKYESVPRYRKRPADLAWEGSNNQLIVFGTDRVGPIADYDDDPDKGKQPKPHDGDNTNEDKAGMIDIVVGRGQTDKTAGKAVDNSIGKKEVGKSKKDLVENEGDPDFVADRSRIYIANQTPVDKNFGLDKYNASKAVDSKSDVNDLVSGEGAIVVKSDKVRVIARSDVQLIVMGAQSGDRVAHGRLKDVTDTSKWASITLKRSGEIVITPADAAVIKLGGDDADKAVLCTTVNNKGAGGTVTASPIVDTMAGAQGGSDGLNGTFAKKVLLK